MAKFITAVVSHIDVDVSIITCNGIWLRSITIGVSDIIATSLIKPHISYSSSSPVTMSAGLPLYLIMVSNSNMVISSYL